MRDNNEEREDSYYGINTGVRVVVWWWYGNNNNIFIFFFIIIIYIFPGYVYASASQMQ